MFVFLSVFFWSLYVCTFFDQRDMITPLVSQLFPIVLTNFEDYFVHVIIQCM